MFLFGGEFYVLVLPGLLFVFGYVGLCNSVDIDLYVFCLNCLFLFACVWGLVLYVGCLVL